MQFDHSEQVNALAALPPEPKKPRERGIWATTWDAVKAGTAETVATVGKVAKAYGAAQAAADEANPLVVAGVGREAAQRGAQQGRDAIARGEIETDIGRSFRNVAADMRPDPMTATTAENMVFGVVRGLTKAVGSTVALGPAGGAALFGASEADVTFEDLRSQGVDAATAGKVAAVAGVVGAGTVALPMVGQTLKATAGLYLAGGPGGFMAQQQLTRSILERADYADIAKQYDPLDTMGWVMSASIPLPFFGYGVWRNIKATKSAAQQGAQPAPTVEPVAAKPEPAPSPEAVDAAMVHNLTLLRDAKDAGMPFGDRRTDSATRRKVAEMSPDEMRAALMTDEMTGLGNRRAYEDAPKQPVQASIDADSLKWINDNMGHQAGDDMLRAIGAAMKAEGLDGYHISGDEFVAQFKTQAEAAEALARVTKRLEQTVISMTQADGSVVQKTGVQITAGIGKDYEAADAALKQSKAEREAAGLRAARGEAPAGVKRTADPFSERPRTVDELPPAAEVADSLRTLSGGAYWAQRGGSIMRDPRTAIDPNSPTAYLEGDVVGRTPWIPAEEWFARMRQELGANGLANKAQIEAAVELAIKGEKLNAKQQRTVDFMRLEVDELQRRLALSEFGVEDPAALARAAFDEGLSSRDDADVSLTARAAEIDPDAVERAAMRFESDDAGFTAEMRRIVDEQPKQDKGTGAGSAEVRAPQPDPGPDLGRFADAFEQARAALNDFTASKGDDLAGFLKARGVPAEVNNLVVGLADAAGSAGRLAGLVQRLASEAKQASKAAADATADAVDAMRALTFEQIAELEAPKGKPVADELTRSIGDRVQQIELENPGLKVSDDATAAEFMAAARREAAEGTDTELGALDAELLRVAADCALS